jgi:hypothetical protein
MNIYPIKMLNTLRNKNFNQRLLDEIIAHADFLLAMEEVEGNPLPELSTEEVAVLLEARNLLNACVQEVELQLDDVIQ